MSALKTRSRQLELDLSPQKWAREDLKNAISEHRTDAVACGTLIEPRCKTCGSDLDTMGFCNGETPTPGPHYTGWRPCPIEACLGGVIDATPPQGPVRVYQCTRCRGIGIVWVGI